MLTVFASLSLATLSLGSGALAGDPDVEFSLASSASVEAGGNVALEVQLSGTHTLDVHVPYTLAGNAVPGVDFTVPPGPLVIPAGQLTGDIVVTLLDDLTMEADELLVVDLGAPTNGNLGSQVSHTLTILNDDTPQTGGRNSVVRPLEFSAEELTLPTTRIGDVSSPVQLSVLNNTGKPVELSKLEFVGDEALNFLAQPSSALPFVIPDGGSLPVDVHFTPIAPGPRAARLVLGQNPGSHVQLSVSVSGTAFGAPGEEILMTAGSDEDYLADNGSTYLADYGTAAPGQVINYPFHVLNTRDPGLYQTARAAPVQHWEWELPNGQYLVSFLFAELEHDAPDQRVFDVDVEGVTVRKNLDIYAQVGKAYALQISEVTEVTDGLMEVDFMASVGFSILNGIEVRSMGNLAATPTSVDFGVVDVGQVGQTVVTLENTGLNSLASNSLSIQVVNGDASDFTIELQGIFYQGSSFTTSHSIALRLQPGETAPATFYYTPTAHGFHDLRVQIRGDHPTLELPVAGGAGVGGDPYLHPVIVVPPIVVDYELDGAEDTLLDGSGSHTHEPGHILTGWEWRESTVLLASTEKATLPFATGQHTVELNIIDDNSPAHMLTTTADFEVVGVDEVPGVLALYYVPGAGQTANDLLDAVPANADYAEVRTGLEVGNENGIGGSGFLVDTMVRALSQVQVGSAGTYVFSATGGNDVRLEIDGLPVTGPVALSAGLHDLEARWAVAGTLELPLDVLSDLGGGAPAPIDPALLTHDQRDTLPVINSMPDEGINLGGNQIVIDGFGFFPLDQVVLHWGNLDLTENDWTQGSGHLIEFISPPGSGIIDVSVETPLGVSNVRQFEYKTNGPVPIVFNAGPFTGVNLPTAAEWGPDGRLYVGSLDGTIHAITYNDDYSVQSVSAYPGVSSLSNPAILGLTFDPYAPQGSVSLYVGHSELYAQGGGAFSGSAPYPGQVSRLDGPNFDTPVAIVDDLPTSNHDHAVNAMVFDSNGDMLLCVGSNTNAGVPHPNIGNLPESPLSAAILKVALSRPDFNGDLVYVETATGQVNMDQVFGGIVDVQEGSHVTVHAAGIRNPLDLAYTTWNELYCTDNGPNSTFGTASTGPTTQTSAHASDIDEILHVEYGRYYGAANRNRGRYDDIENVWFSTSAGEVPGFTQHIATVQSSMNGIAEYRATTFNEQLRHNLITQKFNAGMWRIELSSDKKSVDKVSALPVWPSGLNVVTGPGGALIAIDFQTNLVGTWLPQDQGAVGLTVYDIYPWRSPAPGGGTFVIGGANFGAPGSTTVTIGGNPATLTSVTPTRIKGIIPANAGPSAGLLDVVVSDGAVSMPLRQAFQYLPATPGLVPGKWTNESNMPVPLGEVASGAIAGKLYVVGETSVKTLAYDFATGTWDDTLAVRPFVGHHHATETYGGKWYLIGGLGAGQGRVQIYDPVSNTWSTGAGMPWAGGSVSTCLIGDKIYAAGGIVGSTTVDDCAVYDIQANSWTTLASMPFGKGRNHAASGTNGTHFFIFGGRGVGSGAGNFVANGFADVQLYDPQSNSWSASFDPGSTLVPLPIGRGGTGRSVFYKGEFYVFGGETLTGAGATASNVYDRVDVYDPRTNTWRLEASMPTARHGISPVIWQGRVYLAGGGVAAGFSNSAVFESFYRP